MLEWIHNIDAQILLFIQQYLRSDLFTWLWKGITFLGDGGWFWIVLGLLFLFPKKTRKAGVTALLALTIGAVVTNLCLNQFRLNSCILQPKSSTQTTLYPQQS